MVEPARCSLFPERAYKNGSMAQANFFILGAEAKVDLRSQPTPGLS